MLLPPLLSPICSTGQKFSWFMILGWMFWIETRVLSYHSNSSLRRYIKKIGNEIESLCSLNLSPIVIFLLLFSCRDHCTKLIEPKNGLEKSFSLNLFLDPACGLFWNVVVYWKIDVFFLNIWIFVESVDLGTYFPSTCDSKLRKLKERFKSWIKDWWYWSI